MERGKACDMEDSTSSPSASTQASWPSLIQGDYSVGVVRLATLVRDRVNHLLFASVELLPSEMPVPPDGGDFNNFDDDRLCVGRTVLPIDQALAWYDDLLRGDCRVPRQPFPVTAADFGPEPTYRGFSLHYDPPPFSPAWHGRPRLHRLVRMGDLAAPIAELRDGAAEVPAAIRAREWLREHLHFDLLAYDDWLASGVLVAPNPLLRNCRARIVARSTAGETLEVGGRPRRGADLRTLRITIREERAGAAGWHTAGAPDLLGRLRDTCPSEVEAVAHDVDCSERGLLDREAPGHFFREIWMGAFHDVRQRQVDPPRRTSSGAPLTVTVRHAETPPPSPLTALRQLERLQRALAQRTGDLRPAEQPQGPASVHLLENDRESTRRHIRRLVAQARVKVLFVDPYLDADDLQEFATAAEQEGVIIMGLINPRPKRSRKEEVAGERVGDLLLKQIKAMRAPTQGFGDIDIRVSTARRLHDRFLQIDDVVWHCGHSFNKMGTGEISLMTRVAEPAEIRDALADAFARAEPFEGFWARQAEPSWSLKQEIATRLRRLAAFIERPW